MIVLLPPFWRFLTFKQLLLDAAKHRNEASYSSQGDRKSKGSKTYLETGCTLDLQEIGSTPKGNLFTSEKMTDDWWLHLKDPAKSEPKSSKLDDLGHGWSHPSKFRLGLRQFSSSSSGCLLPALRGNSWRQAWMVGQSLLLHRLHSRCNLHVCRDE